MKTLLSEDVLSVGRTFLRIKTHKVTWMRMLSSGQKEVGERKAHMKMVTADGRKDEEQKSVLL